MKTTQELVKELYEIVKQLDELHAKHSRYFTPDGHLIGSIGECLIADMFDLALMDSSNKGFDAKKGDKEIEIKVTQGNSVAFRHESKYAIVGVLCKEKGTIEIIYNGLGNTIWKQFEGKERPSNGQYSISITKLKTLNKDEKDENRITK